MNDNAAKVLEEIAAERRRQVEVEGWTPEHDDGHVRGSLARAGAVYATLAAASDEVRGRFPAVERPPIEWPWGPEWWKPTTARRDLIKAGALIVAEIERLDRQAPPKDQTNG